MHNEVPTVIILNFATMKATRPGEYVCLCKVIAPTREGMAHIYFAIDAFADYLIQTNVETDDNPETILKNIYLLTENKDFQSIIMKGFTLVLDDYQELAPRIKAIIEPHGTLLFDVHFHNKVCAPAIESLYRSLERK